MNTTPIESAPMESRFSHEAREFTHRRFQP